jgi:hypothetical protein
LNVVYEISIGNGSSIAIFENMISENCIKKSKENISGTHDQRNRVEECLDLMVEVSIAEEFGKAMLYVLYQLGCGALVEVQRIASVMLCLDPGGYDTTALHHTFNEGKKGWRSTFRSPWAAWAIRMWRAVFYLYCKMKTL